MIIRATYTPKTEADHKTWDIDYDELLVDDIITLEQLAGETLVDFEQSIREGSKTALMQLLYVWRSRDEDAVTFADVRAMRYADLAFTNPPEVPAGKESGDSEPEAPEAPTQ